MPLSRISQLAQSILQNTEIVEKYYLDHEYPLPSFEIDALEDTTIHDDIVAEKARLDILEASREMYDLMQGPVMQIRPDLNATSLQVIYRYNLPSKVPIDGNISYEALSKASGLATRLLRRIVRFAIVHHRIFQEKEEGYVSHSAASRLLATTQDAMALVSLYYDEVYPAFPHNVNILQRGLQPTRNECAWTASQGSSLSLYETLLKDPARGERFTKAMSQLSRGFGHESASLIRGIDWASILDQEPNALVVDLGGANGHASVLIAREHAGLRFEVQDLPKVVDAVQNDIPADLKDRISFRSHDLRQPQPTEADVYLIRKTFHNWPDANCIEALQALTCALKPGARVIINEALAGPPNAFPHLAQKSTTSQDLIMLTMFGTEEREERDWARIFKEADSRFINFKAHLPDCCSVAIIEATWSG